MVWGADQGSPKTNANATQTQHNKLKRNDFTQLFARQRHTQRNATAQRECNTGGLEHQQRRNNATRPAADLRAVDHPTAAKSGQGVRLRRKSNGVLHRPGQGSAAAGRPPALHPASRPAFGRRCRQFHQSSIRELDIAGESATQATFDDIFGAFGQTCRKTARIRGHETPPHLATFGLAATFAGQCVGRTTVSRQRRGGAGYPHNPRITPVSRWFRRRDRKQPQYSLPDFARDDDPTQTY